MLFRGAELTAWIGLLVVTQNIVGSLVNSHLFDFTQAWLYIFGVGVAGGMALQKRDYALTNRVQPMASPYDAKMYAETKPRS
jgi:hypothetical protein